MRFVGAATARYVPIIFIIGYLHIFKAGDLISQKYCHALKVQLTPLFFAKLCFAITRQPIELESCSKPLRIQKVFWLRLKNNFFCFGFYGGDVTSGGVLRFLANFTRPWAPI